MKKIADRIAEAVGMHTLVDLGEIHRASAGRMEYVTELACVEHKGAYSLRIRVSRPGQTKSTHWVYSTKQSRDFAGMRVKIDEILALEGRIWIGPDPRGAISRFFDRLTSVEPVGRVERLEAPEYSPRRGALTAMVRRHDGVHMVSLERPSDFIWIPLTSLRELRNGLDQLEIDLDSNGREL